MNIFNILMSDNNQDCNKFLKSSNQSNTIKKVIIKQKLKRQIEIEYQIKNIKDHLSECISWAKNKPEYPIKTKEKSIKLQKNKLEKEEKNWGNKMICKKNCGQWTTLLGEYMVYIILYDMGLNPIRPIKKKWLLS